MNRMHLGGRRPVRDRRPQPYAPQPQPLLSNQLGLQDIDLELELLKRKREIIEQQQQMLNNDFLPRNRFGEFSHMYEDRGSYGAGSSGNKKRPQVWEHDSPPKRFATGNIIAPNKSFNPPFRAQVKKPNPQAGFQPRSSNFQPRFGPSSSAAKKKDFKLSKVSKPSPAPPPNKLNSYNEAERVKLVTATVSADSLILRPDRPASNQLNGRLELALGHIVKEIRTKFPEYEEQLTNNVGRAIKQALRDRLRACMMGKPVNLLQETVKIYRETFPPETDKELLLNSLEEQSKTDFISIESDNPQEFFTKNLGRLMNKKLEEMFHKLGEIYSPDIPPEPYPKKTDITTDKNGLEVKDNDNKPNDADVQMKTEQKENQEEVDKTDIDKETPSNTDKDNDEKYKKIISTEEYQRLDRLMTEMLPHMLKKFTPLLLKLMKLSGIYRNTLSSIKQELRKKIVNDGEKITPQKKQPNLPKPIPKSDVINVEEKQKKGEKVEVQKKVYQPLPYFAKIYGRPSLPKRKAMQTFFENFKSKSIKKHRTIHNILFVSFYDKQEFEKLLAANGTVIGRNTLIITVSERSKPTPDCNNESLDIINDDLDNQITELLSSIKKSEGLLEENDVEMTSNDAKPEVKAENDIIIVDNETKLDPIVDITDKADVEISENDITDKTVQENGATEEAIEENNKEKAIEKNNKEKAIEENNKEEVNTANENAAEVAVPDNYDTNTENQDGLKEDIKIENNDPTTDEDHEKEKDVENITEESEKTDTVQELKSEVKEVKATPTRSSARLASTPSAIRTRRASKLADNS